MKNDDLKTILGDLAENAKPAAQVDLWSGLEKSLKTSDGYYFQEKSTMNSNFAFRRAAFAALVLVFALAILLATPQGRAFAQQLLEYFTIAPGKRLPPIPTQVPAATYTLEARLVPPQTPTLTAIQDCGEVISPISSTFVCQLQDAQSKLGFEVKSFPARYVQEQFRIMEVDLGNRIVVIRFSGYGLSQGIGDFPKDCPGCAVYEKAVQPVRVGAYQAEYVAGSFVFDEDGGMAWDASSSQYRLRWKEGERWYALEANWADAMSGLNPAQVKAKMIQIAENLVGLAQGIENLSAARQPSIKDSIGFALKEPGILPEGFQQVPDGSWSNLTTMPRVGMRYDYRVNGEWKNSLVFYQMLIPKDEQTLRREFALIYQHQSLVDGEWTDTGRDEEIRIHGQIGYYMEADDPGCNGLYWRDDEREYMLLYYWDSAFGGRLDKETLIAIAESLK